MRGTGAKPRGYKGDADLFGVFCKDNQSTYLVPVDHVPSTVVTLRVDAARNNNWQRVRYAKDYDIETLVDALSERSSKVEPGVANAQTRGSNPPARSIIKQKDASFYKTWRPDA